MSLRDLLELDVDAKKIGLSEERISKIVPVLRSYTSFWREYPDLFVDFLTGDREGTLHLYFYQRVFMRAVMRHKYVYAVFPRAYSKSFLAMLVLMIRCILYPRAQLFVTSGGKAPGPQPLKECVVKLQGILESKSDGDKLSTLEVVLFTKAFH